MIVFVNDLRERDGAITRCRAGNGRAPSVFLQTELSLLLRLPPPHLSTSERGSAYFCIQEGSGRFRRRESAGGVARCRVRWLDSCGIRV